MHARKIPYCRGGGCHRIDIVHGDRRRGRHTVQGWVCLRQPDQRCRMDFSARLRAQGDGKGARRQSRRPVRRKCSRGRGRRTRDTRPRQLRQSAHLHDVVRIHESDDQGRAAVSQDLLRARDRLQARQQRRHVQRALLRGTLSRGHCGRQHDQDRRRGLRRRIPDSRGRDGHQRVHPRHAQRQAQRRGQGRLGKRMVRSGTRARGGRHAGFPRRRRPHAPYRFDRRGAGRGGEKSLCHRLSLGHVQIWTERPPHRGDASMGRVLHQDRAGRDRRKMEAGQRVGWNQGKNDQDGTVQSDRTPSRAGQSQSNRR